MIRLRPIFIVLIIVLINGCKDDNIVLNAKNHLKIFSSVKTQIFELNTISDTIIKGNKGTTIHFNRDAFEINNVDEVIVELREYYELNELIYNNINTVTDKNELLETSGVIYLDFKVNNRPIKLKKQKNLIIQFPVKNDYKNKIYKANFDSIGKINWSEKNVEVLFTADMIRTKFARGVFAKILVKESFMVPIDSLSYFKEKYERDLTELNRIDSVRNANYLKRENLIISINRDFGFGYINIDQVIEFDNKTKYNFSILNKKIDNISFYVFYENLNSFLSFFVTADNLNIGEIPVIYGETYLIAVSEINGAYYGQKTRLTKELKSDIKLNLKRMELSQIKDLINH